MLSFDSFYYMRLFFKYLQKTLLICLMVTCIFDPADKLIGIKLPVFILGWMIFLLDIIINKKQVALPITMIIYLGLFIFIIPLISIYYYALTNGDFSKYDGLLYFKTYLFLSIVLVLYIAEIDLIKPLIAILSILSATTIIIFAVDLLNGSTITNYVASIGEYNEILRMGSRTFGDFEFPMIYFETSPLIVFATCYFTSKFLNSRGFLKKCHGALLVINIAAMLLGASRSNMIVSIIAPIFIIFWRSKKKILIAGIVVGFMSLFIMNNMEVIQGMFDTQETSNDYKISFLQDYLNLFSHEKILLFGQGLGAYFTTGMRGSVSVTELTYFELVRRLGIFLSIPTFLLILYPLIKLSSARYAPDHFIFISYMLYLVMCTFNPLLLSSTGMLLLSIVLHKTFAPTQCQIQMKDCAGFITKQRNHRSRGQSVPG